MRMRRKAQAERLRATAQTHSTPRSCNRPPRRCLDVIAGPGRRRATRLAPATPARGSRVAPRAGPSAAAFPKGAPPVRDDAADRPACPSSPISAPALLTLSTVAHREPLGVAHTEPVWWRDRTPDMTVV